MPTTATQKLSSLPPGLDVYLGDSRNMAEVPDKSVDFFMTSPPYWK